MRVKVIAEINPTPSTPIEARPFIDYIDTASVNEGRLNEVQHLVDVFPSRAQREVYTDDILISSVRPNLKHNYYVKQPGNGMVASSGFIQLRVKNIKEIVPQFLYYFLTSPSKIEYYTRIADSSQSAYPSFNKDVIEDIEFPEIPFPTQLRIAGIISKQNIMCQLAPHLLFSSAGLVLTIHIFPFPLPFPTSKPTSRRAFVALCTVLSAILSFVAIALRDSVASTARYVQTFAQVKRKSLR